MEEERDRGVGVDSGSEGMGNSSSLGSAKKMKSCASRGEKILVVRDGSAAGALPGRVPGGGLETGAAPPGLSGEDVDDWLECGLSNHPKQLCIFIKRHT